MNATTAPTASTTPTPSDADDGALLRELLTAIRPEHLAFLKMAVPPALFEKVAARAKAAQAAKKATP